MIVMVDHCLRLLVLSQTHVLKKMSTYTLLTCDIVPEGITVEAVVRLQLTLPIALG